MHLMCSEMSYCAIMLLPTSRLWWVAQQDLSSPACCAMKCPAVSYPLCVPFHHQTATPTDTCLCSASTNTPDKYGQKGWENKELFFRCCCNPTCEVTQLAAAVRDVGRSGCSSQPALPLPPFCIARLLSCSTSREHASGYSALPLE